MQSILLTGGAGFIGSNFISYLLDEYNEKLIPTIIRKALNGESIPIYGYDKNIRDWLYMFDYCKGIDIVYHTGVRNERTNLQIVDTVCNILDKKIPRKSSYKDLITFVQDRMGDDRRYTVEYYLGQYNA